MKQCIQMDLTKDDRPWRIILFTFFQKNKNEMYFSEYGLASTEDPVVPNSPPLPSNVPLTVQKSTNTGYVSERNIWVFIWSKSLQPTKKQVLNSKNRKTKQMKSLEDGIQDVSVAPHCVLMTYDLGVEV